MPDNTLCDILKDYFSVVYCSCSLLTTYCSLSSVCSLYQGRPDPVLECCSSARLSVLQGRKCSQGKQDPRWKYCLPGRTDVPADLWPSSSGSGHSWTIWASCVCFYYLILFCKNWINIIFILFHYVFIIMPCFFFSFFYVGGGNESLYWQQGNIMSYFSTFLW